MHLSKVNNSHKDSCCFDQVFRLNIMSLYDNLVHLRLSALEENKPVNYLCCREDIDCAIKQLERKIIKNCYYCHRCKDCVEFRTRHNELSRNGFRTFHKDVIYWDVRKPEFDAKNFAYEIRPVLKEKIED